MSISSDLEQDQRELRKLQRQMEQAEREGLAVQAALSEHSVTSYVKRLPVESTLYPAIEYLVLANRMGRNVEDVYDHFRKIRQERNQGIDQEGPSFQTATLDSYTDGQEGTIQEGQGIPDVDHAFDGIEDPYRPHEFIHWCVPAHDLSRPQRKGCGFIRSSNGSIVYSACPEDAEHYIKGKRRHCWSLHCPECMNDTALKRGIAVEKRMLEYQMLTEKQGKDPGKVGHWVVSPPQELIKCLCQTRDEFEDINRYIEQQMKDRGGRAGVQVFHPWRQTDDKWEFSPHFHILCYGFIDTKRFLKDNPGWIIKKVHSHEDIKSIRHTIAYLMTHMGLPLYEKDPDDIDWDLEVLNHLIPGIKSKDADYSEDDWSRKGENRGKMVGEVTGIDWEDWPMQRLTGKFRLRYWGATSCGNIRTLDIVRQYRIRVCKECGTPLRTYDGSDDTEGSYVRYIQDDPVVVFRENYDRAKEVLDEFMPRFREEGLTATDFAKASNFAVSTLELPTPKNDDLVMSGPFAEPDEYFTSKQEIAYGEPDTLITDMG